MNELGDRLYRVLNRHLERGDRVDIDELARVCRVQLLRPGALPRLSDKQRAALFSEIERASHRLRDPTDRAQLRRFIDDVVFASERVARPRGARAFTRYAAIKSAAKDAVLLERHRGSGDEDIVKRAVTRALKERKRSRGMRPLVLERDDPMREVLKLAPDARAVARDDLRRHILDQMKTPLGQALSDSVRFSEESLRPILGEELWLLCRPTGFCDRHRRRVLVVVQSSALAQEVAMRRTELLRRLRAAPGFSQIRDVRFEVADSAR